MVADALADRADGRELAQQRAHRRRLAPGSARSTSLSGSVRNTSSISSSTVAVSSASDSWLALVGRERRVVGLGGEHGVHPADHLAEAARAADERLRVGRRKLLLREAPAVDRVRNELLHHAERRAHQRARVRPPAPELRRVLEAVRRRRSGASPARGSRPPRPGGRPSRSARRRPRPRCSTARRRASARHGSMRRHVSRRPSQQNSNVPSAASSIAPRTIRSTSSRANAGSHAAS